MSAQSIQQTQFVPTSKERFHEVMNDVLKNMSLASCNFIIEDISQNFYFLSSINYEIYSYCNAPLLKVEKVRFFPMKPTTYELVKNTYIDVGVIKRIGYIPRENSAWRLFINM